MELRDLLVTPLFIIVVYAGAYLIRPYATDQISRKYFFPALTIKIIGALSLGLIYTFYYDGGDTFKYHTFGSRKLWEILWESPSEAVELFLFVSEDIYNKYILGLPIINDPPSFFVARISFVFDLLTFSTYSATAILFGVFSFTGMWLFFQTFYKKYPDSHRGLAISILFIPSVSFWGSGILKDTITLGCVGIATFYTHKIFIERSFSFHRLFMLMASLYVIFVVKKYILFCFFPAALLWVFFGNLATVRYAAVKIILMPFVLAISIFFGYYAILKVGEGDEKYSIDKLANTAKITAYDIRYQTGRDAGSGYELGELDGTITGALRLFPQAINVSLFRPYVWEVKNPLMLLSALESLGMLLFLIYVIRKSKRNFFKAILRADVLFCLVFSISFAFSVGISTFNFGTLVRYKIPLLPFFSTGLVIILNYINKLNKPSGEFTDEITQTNA